MATSAPACFLFVRIWQAQCRESAGILSGPVRIGRLQRKSAIVQGWFAIEVEKDLKLIRLTMGGFFESATIVEMRARMVEAIATLACAANDHLTLCDICEMDIQSQERVGEFAKLVGSDDVRSRRLAFVTARSLARLQAKRLTSREGVAFFTDKGEAVDWLTS
ncbi:hypothetical protein ACNI3R_05555 [Rhizorhabdus sp. FW153]